MELFHRRTDVVTRWASFENPDAAPGAGGHENKGGKGHAFDTLPAGQSVTLMKVQGSGTIRRIWMTFDMANVAWLRDLRVEMRWDGCDIPAVCAPVGELFCQSPTGLVAFENELFASPEARSLVCYVPMPFRNGAEVRIVNTTDTDLPLFFYDIDFELAEHEADILYYQAIWREENPNALGVDYTILPRIEGVGRFLGANITILADKESYGDMWWGEGEVKVYLDEDDALPTLVGTGTEDYVGSGWGLGPFAHRYQGSPKVDKDAGIWTFYRLHIPDAVYFHSACKVTLQCMGGDMKPKILDLMGKGATLQPVSVDSEDGFIPLLDLPEPVTSDCPEWRHGWTNCYRQDHYASVAYVYLDRPEGVAL
jgi:hypothetical protein